MNHILLFMAVTICTLASAQDKRLTGTWDNDEGQRFVFQENGKAFWIIYDATERDTFNVTYTTNFTVTPLQLDLGGFTRGPLKGKTMFGIVEYLDANTMRFDCEPGLADTVRPKTFNPKQTQTYKKK